MPIMNKKSKVPNKGKKSCQGFSYTGPKLWMPKEIGTITKRGPFKLKLKEWKLKEWSHIPSI